MEPFEQPDASPVLPYQSRRIDRFDNRLNRIVWGLAALGMIGILVIVWMLNTPRNHNPRRMRTNAEIAALRAALAAFEMDNSRLPTTREGLAALLYPAAGVTNWHGPYIPHLPLDGYGTPLDYQSPARSKPYEIRSAGPDKLLGTGDDTTSTP